MKANSKPFGDVDVAASGPVILAPGELYGGVERQVVDLHGKLSERIGREPAVLLFHEGELARRIGSAGGDVHIIEARHRYDPAAATHLARYFENRNAMVVHAHGYRAMVTLAVAAIRGYQLPPVVKTEHGLPEPMRNRPFDTVKAKWNHLLDRWATRRLQATVCYVTDDIRSRFDHAHAGLVRHTVPNGIAPLERTGAVRPDGVPAGGFNFGIVGRVSEVKGIEYALRALASPDMPPAARCVVVGSGPQEEHLRRCAREFGVSDRVVFLGFRRDVYEIMAHLDALLMPSLHEGLPYTLLEAMSLGLPVLASQVGGLDEVLVDGETGLLFPCRDAGAIATACRRLMLDRDLAVRLGASAAREQRRRYTLEGMTGCYEAVYLESSVADNVPGAGSATPGA